MDKAKVAEENSKDLDDHCSHTAGTDSKGISLSCTHHSHKRKLVVGSKEDTKVLPEAAKAMAKAAYSSHRELDKSQAVPISRAATTAGTKEV